MTTELAEVIRTLRRDHGVDYMRLGFYLCETDPDVGGSFGLGKEVPKFDGNADPIFHGTPAVPLPAEHA